jgi:hypothetical protein
LLTLRLFTHSGPQSHCGHDGLPIHGVLTGMASQEHGLYGLASGRTCLLASQMLRLWLSGLLVKQSALRSTAGGRKIKQSSRFALPGDLRHSIRTGSPVQRPVCDRLHRVGYSSITRELASLPGLAVKMRFGGHASSGFDDSSQRRDTVLRASTWYTGLTASVCYGCFHSTTEGTAAKQDHFRAGNFSLTPLQTRKRAICRMETAFISGSVLFHDSTNGRERWL